MREIPEAKPSQDGGTARFVAAALVACMLGGFAGANLFPVVETKFVEKRVEVPVEVIKYVERVVEKRVEVPVEKIVERIVYRHAPTNVSGDDKFKWRKLNRGMAVSEVRSLIGEPERITTGDAYFSWYFRNSGKVFFIGGSVDSWDEPEF